MNHQKELSINTNKPPMTRLALYRAWKREHRKQLTLFGGDRPSRAVLRRFRMYSFCIALFAPKYRPDQPWSVTEDTTVWKAQEYYVERLRIAQRQIAAGWYGSN